MTIYICFHLFLSLYFSFPFFHSVLSSRWHQFPIVRLLQGPWNTSKFMRTNCWRCASLQFIQRRCWTSKMSPKRYLNIDWIWIEKLLHRRVYWNYLHGLVVPMPLYIVMLFSTQFLCRFSSLLFSAFIFHSSAINCCRTVYIYIQSRPWRMQKSGVKYRKLHWGQQALVKSASLPGCCWHRKHRFVSIIVPVFRLIFLFSIACLFVLRVAHSIFIIKFTRSSKLEMLKNRKRTVQMGNSLHNCCIVEPYPWNVDDFILFVSFQFVFPLQLKS